MKSTLAMESSEMAVEAHADFGGVGDLDISFDQSDGDEEEVLLFDSRGDALKYKPKSTDIFRGQNGHLSSKVKSYFEGGILASVISSCSWLSKPCNAQLVCIVVTLIISAVWALLVFTVIIPAITTPLSLQPSPEPVSLQPSPEWSLDIDDFGTEASIHLIDVNGDGALDVLIGPAYADTLANVLNCQHIKDLPSLCGGFIIALNGINGSELWRFRTVSEAIFFSCDGLDIDGDGQLDCVTTGRFSMVVAFDPRKGVVLWRNQLRPPWNAYRALALPDCDGDGILDLLIPSGGDPKYSNTELDRPAGHLYLVSGATGVTIGRYLNVSESRETYMSPVLYTANDQSQYILFGSGGETISGNLSAISVPDFYRYVNNLASTDPVPNTHGAYKDWQHKLRDINGVFHLYSSGKKGVMVPPVIVDVNNDGVLDILMTAYDGVMIPFNGRTLAPLWRVNFPECEAYGSPAPGYFDDDEFLDFLITWNRGLWPIYNYSLNVILSGKDGSVLWASTASKYDMISHLVLKTTQTNRDVFLLATHGRQSGGSTDVDNALEQLGLSEDRKRRVRRHGHKDHEDRAKCTDDMRKFITELFVLDRSVLNAPLRLGEFHPGTYSYNVSESASHTNSTDHAGILITPENQKRPKRQSPELSKLPGDELRRHKRHEIQECFVYENMERSTGGIGDVDGDGTLDYIGIHMRSAALYRAGGGYIKSKYKMSIQKINLQTKLKNLHHIPFKSYTSEKLQQSTETLDDLNNVQFAPMEKQLWIKYLGKTGQSIYKKDR